MTIDFGVVVATQLEYDTTLKRFGEKVDRILPYSFPFVEGSINGFSVILAKCAKQGSVNSCLATTDLLREFQPRHIVLLGIAAGYPDEVQRGDVIIADCVIGYEYSKVYDDSTEYEPRYYTSPEVPIESFSRQNSLIKLNNGLSPDSTSNIKIGTIASGSKLVASELFRNKISILNRKICALEMEAEGVAAAAHHFSNRPFFVFKGISDFANSATKGQHTTTDQKKQHDYWQKLAAQASVEVFCMFLDFCKNNNLIVPSVAYRPVIWDEKNNRNVPIPDEEGLLTLVRQSPSLKLGNVDLKCNLFPPTLWDVRDRRKYTFFDEPERSKQIFVDFIDTPLPQYTLSAVIQELSAVIKDPKSNERFSQNQIEHFTEAFRRLTKEGSNAYPRIVAPPTIITEKNLDKASLQILIAPSRYGIALIEERDFKLPTANDLRISHVLNSLAVRVAVVFEDEGQLWTEFHQRRSDPNATYKGAWDVGAAGYLDPIDHIDPENPSKISPFRACASEIEQELNIPQWNLQNREHYYFFGVGRNDPTGQIDILSLCYLASAPDPNREVTPRVSNYARCLLTPETVADFVLEKQYWVPTALLTLVLILEWYGFDRARIEAAFSRCEGKLILEP